MPILSPRAATCFVTVLFAFTASCRGCSPPQPSSGSSARAAEDVAPPNEPRQAANEPRNEPAPAPPPPAEPSNAPAAQAPQPPADAGPRVGHSEIVARLRRGLPLAEVVRDVTDRADIEAATNYLRCLTVSTPQACDRLGGEEPALCRMDAEQVAARARGDRGWVATPAVIAFARRHNVSEADVRRYGEAVETGDPARCPTQFQDRSDCAAVAANDAARCDQLQAQERDGCRRHVAFLGRLRQGPAGLAQLTDSAYPPLAIGARGAAACESILTPPPAQPQ